MSEPAILVQPSPLHTRTAPLCLTNCWVQDARLTLVDVYRSLDEEYWALREGVGLFDASAFFAYRISGPDALAGVEHLVTRQVAHLAPGAFTQTVWCDDYGHVIGVGRVLCIDAETYELQTRARALAWIEDTVAGLRCRVDETTGADAGLGLVGPRASSVLDHLGAKAAIALASGQTMAWETKGLSLRIGRMGSCGSPAFRLWVKAADAPLAWDRVMAAGAEEGLKPVGARARELARIEAGLPRLGVDFVSALEAVPWSSAATPAALGLATLVDDGKGLFVGRTALRRAPEPSQVLARLQVEAEGPYAPAFILKGARPVGFVTSGAWSPLMGAGFAFAWVEAEALAVTQPLRLMRPPRLGQPLEPNGVPCAVRDDAAVGDAIRTHLDTVQSEGDGRVPLLALNS